MKKILEIVNIALNDGIDNWSKISSLIKGDNRKRLFEYTSFLDDVYSSRQIRLCDRIYCLINNINSIDDIPKCKICNDNIVKFKYDGSGQGFSEACSPKCGSKLGSIRGTTKEAINKASKTRKDTFLNKYGVEHVSQIEEVKQKKKETTLKNYDSFKEAYHDTAKKTILKKYGVENISQLDDIKDKKKQTCIDNFNVEFPMQSKEVRNKSLNTLKDKYDVTNISQVEEIKIKKIIKYYTNNSDCIFQKLNNSIYSTPIFDKNELIQSRIYNKPLKFKCKMCNEIIYSQFFNVRHEKCFPIKIQSSKYEDEIYLFLINELNIQSKQIIRNDRNAIKPKEIDLYLPEYNFAIEFNGTYYHSELNGKDSNYHKDKYISCDEKNIKLIQIFEHEWNDIYKQEIIKSIIKYNLNIIDRKIFARKCNIVKLNNDQIIDFLNSNHIQGYINSSINYGLLYNNELVYCITFGNSRYNKNYEYEILRSCSKINTNIIGGFEKLIKYFIKNNNPESIITYVDCRYFNGKYYKNSNMFIYDGMTKANYYYTNDYVNLESRIKFQKHKLNSLLDNFDSNLTEWENMQLNNYDRIWDSGNLKFIYRKTNNEY